MQEDTSHPNGNGVDSNEHTAVPASENGAPRGAATTTDNGIVTLSGMYQDYFLDYASYVILERAVPDVEDGLKPVQRRILHALREMDDGRFHKVANVIGQTMQYHPHGDAAIGDAMVNIGQKELLLDTQGNWGDYRTGDSAAAPRYIEVRLSKFALDVAFNPQTTDWQATYDGRKREPLALPMKFPLLLAQGGEGIAVGLSTKILPHNFQELIRASIKHLEGKSFKLYPDFATGGMVDVAEYNRGKRGGRVKVRAKIEKLDKNTLLIKELPYGVTTGSLQDSIVKANEKGKIKIKRVTDNTAAEVEVRVELASGVSPDLTIDALYAFTNCEVSISPNACVIVDNKPYFLTVDDILRTCTDNTKRLLKWELDLLQGELEEKLHFASLEKIFIQNRIYREIEEATSWEQVVEIIDENLANFVATPTNPKKGKRDKRIELLRDVSEEDITRLTEIRIKRISKYNAFKADERIKNLEEELTQTKHHLAHLTEYTIAYFNELLKKYGKGRERRTQITTFDSIAATEVVANNAKLYVNRKEGFIGTGLKRDDFVQDCSDIDDIIAFTKDGKFKVVRVDDKVFVGKNITHVAVWRKGDDRTTYHLMYLDGKTGVTRAKRFHVKAITRDREYELTKGTKGSKMLYFSVTPNGERETVEVQLTQQSRAKIKGFEFDFGELDIKGRAAQGNIVTKHPVRKVVLKETGKSTLGALEVYMDDVSGRINTDARGRHLGAFDTGDKILAVFNDGTYQVDPVDTTVKYDVPSLAGITKLRPDTVVSAVYYEGERGLTLIKRFQIETTTEGERYRFVSDHAKTKLFFATVDHQPVIEYAMRVKRQRVTGEVKLEEFIDVKGWRALGNKLSEHKLSSVKLLSSEKPKERPKKLEPGDTVELDVNTQGELF